MWPAETFSEQPTKATGFSPSWLVTTRRPARHTLQGVHDAFDPIFFSADERIGL